MAYTPTNWSDGDLITAAKLNKLEQGLAGIQVTPGGDTLDLSAYATKADPEFTGSMSMGRRSGTTVGQKSVVLGDSSSATALGAVSIGINCHATGSFSLAAGRGADAEGTNSISLGGTARGGESFAGPGGIAVGTGSFALGYNAWANGEYQVAFGRNNVKSSNESDKLIIGSGYYDESKDDEIYQNCFRVTHTGVFASGAYNATGADYAEFFEWADGNPDAKDRAGRFVTLDGEKIRLAGPGEDYILGIVSGFPSVVGDVYDDQWAGMHIRDVFGRPVWEDVEVPEKTMEIADPEHPGENMTVVISPAHTERRQKLNPDYDPAKAYQPRSERPEWDAVGLLGKLVAVDDGTCTVNGWCTVGVDGVATSSTERTKYRVMARLDDTHIRVMIL